MKIRAHCTTRAPCTSLCARAVWVGLRDTHQLLTRKASLRHWATLCPPIRSLAFVSLFVHPLVFDLLAMVLCVAIICLLPLLSIF
jgi:hypothetical protein